MRGYPQFSFWISIAADMIYLSYIVINSLLHLGQNVITFRTLLHFGSFITFRPSTWVTIILRKLTQTRDHKYL